jgi:hypothetical protein
MPYYAIYFNEDGDPPRLEVVSTKKELLELVGDDPDIIDANAFVPASATGWLVIEGKALKRVDKRVVKEIDLE